MSNFIPKTDLITNDAYLHGCGMLEDINCAGRIVYVGGRYFILENLYDKTAIVVHEDSYWVVQEGDFYEQK